MTPTEHAQLLRELAENIEHKLNERRITNSVERGRVTRARAAAEEIEGLKAPELGLVVKPCGDCWLHIKAPSGRQAAINLGQRGSFNDQTFVGSVILEVAECSLARFGDGEVK